MWSSLSCLRSRSLGTCLVALGLVSGLAACSKGGAGDPASCRKLSDPLPGGPSTDRAIVRSLYAELRTPSGQYLTVPLEGIGGAYAGTRPLTKCDERGQYTVERTVLVNSKQELVAVANRIGNSASFKIDYANGQTTSVAGPMVTNYYTDYGTAVASGAVTLLTVAPSTPQVRQGERMSVTVSLQGDECGLLKSQWWLATASGQAVNGLQPAMQPAVMGGSGSVSLQVPVDLAPGTYYVEGQVMTKNGQLLGVKRQNAAETVYKLYDAKSGLYTVTTYPVVKVDVVANPDADRTAPQAVQMDATPSRVERCQPVNLSLKVSDERALPSSQTVKVWLGPDGTMLTSVELTGGETLYGTFTLPSDAPGGVWYAYPDLIRDAAGNEARSSFSGGKFSLSGMGIGTPKPLQAATFIVPSETVKLDGGVGLPDLAGGSPDLMAAFPAVLSEIKVQPAAITRDGDSLTIRVTWTDTSGTLK